MNRTLKRDAVTYSPLGGVTPKHHVAATYVQRSYLRIPICVSVFLH